MLLRCCSSDSLRFSSSVAESGATGCAVSRLNTVGPSLGFEAVVNVTAARAIRHRMTNMSLQPSPSMLGVMCGVWLGGESCLVLVFCCLSLLFAVVLSDWCIGGMTRMRDGKRCSCDCPECSSAVNVGLNVVDRRRQKSEWRLEHHIRPSRDFLVPFTDTI